MQFHILLINTNASMYLYNTPRDTMAKDPMFQSLCSTSIWNAPGLMPNNSNIITHVLQSLFSTQNVITHVLQSLRSTQDFITHVFQRLRSTQNLINHVLHGLHPALYRTQSCIQSSAHFIAIIISVYALR